MRLILPARCLSPVEVPDHDSGVGFHMSSSAAPPFWGDGGNDNYGYEQNLAFYRDLKQRTGCCRIKQLIDFGEQSYWNCKAATDAGLFVLGRCVEENPGRGYTIGLDQVQRWDTINVRHWEYANEVNLTLEGVGTIEDTCAQIIRNTDIIAQGGGVALIPSMTADSEKEAAQGSICYGNVFRWFYDNQRQWFQTHLAAGHIHIAAHPRDITHPIDYPDDPVNRLGVPVSAEELADWRADIVQQYGPNCPQLAELDDLIPYINTWRYDDKNPTKPLIESGGCVRSYELIVSLCEQYWDCHIPMHWSEAGPEPRDGIDRRYWRTTLTAHTAMALEMVRRFQRNRPQAWPECVQGAYFWLYDEFQHHGWPNSRYIHNTLAGANLPDGRLPALDAIEAYARSAENVDRWSGVQPPVEPPVVVLPPKGPEEPPPVVPPVIPTPVTYAGLPFEANRILGAQALAFLPPTVPWLKSANCKHIKICDPNLGTLQDIKQAIPDAYIVYRHVVDDNYQPVLIQKGTAGAQELADVILREIAPVRQYIDCVSGLNERGYGTEAPYYAAWCNAFGKIMQREGLPYGALDLGVGHPAGLWDGHAEDDWGAFMDGLKRGWELLLPALEYASFIFLHGYNAPRLDSGNPIFTLLRHRLSWQVIPDQYKRPIMLTEFGIDGGVLGPRDPATCGWQNFTDEASYRWQLGWGLAEVLKDPYVVGLHMYHVGSHDAKWEKFGVQECPTIAELVRNQPIIKKEVSTVPEFYFGFKDLHDKYPAAIGKATSPQIDIPGVYSWQATENGYMIWRPDCGVKFFAQSLPPKA
jgi:hypothetical protein